MAKLFRNYNTLAEYEADTNKPVNTVCFIKDAAKFKTVYNALLDELKNRNYMELTKDGKNI